MRADPVTAELRREVLGLDAYRCVAHRIAVLSGEPIDACADRWGNRQNGGGRLPEQVLTLDHVKDQPRMGKRAPSDVRHLVTICWHHHLNGWATAHRPALRSYLALRSGGAL